MITFALQAIVPNQSVPQLAWESRVTKITWPILPRVGEKVHLGLPSFPDNHVVKEVRHNLPLGDNNPFTFVIIEVTKAQMEEMKGDVDWCGSGFGCMFGVYENMLAS